MAWDREKDRKAGKVMGIAGSIYGIVFMVIWCGIAAGMGAVIMLIPGLLMLGFMIFRLVALVRKSKAEKEPKEPWDIPARERPSAAPFRQNGFCPYCGEKMEDSFVFCPKCGRRK
jgi:hypothetical protein